jgi:hypothetical protein
MKGVMALDLFAIRIFHEEHLLFSRLATQFFLSLHLGHLCILDRPPFSHILVAVLGLYPCAVPRQTIGLFHYDQFLNQMGILVLVWLVEVS